MPAPLESKPASRRERVEPLRRKRVQPAPADPMRSRRAVTALLAFAAIVLMVDALVGDRGLVERMRAARKLEAAEAALATLQYQNAVMREQVRRLREDPKLIEAVAREELGLIRPGELLFVVKDAERP